MSRFETWVSITRGSTTTVLDLESGEVIATCVGHSANIRRLALDDAGERLATGASDGEVRLWSSHTGDALIDVPSHEGSVMAVAFRPGHDELVTASFRPAEIRIVDLSTGDIRIRSQAGGNVMRLACSHDGRRIVSLGSMREGYVLDAADGSIVASIDYDAKQMPLWVGFTPDGSTLIATTSRPLSLSSA